MSVINFNQAKAEKEAVKVAEEISEETGFDILGMMDEITDATMVAIMQAKEDTFQAIMKEAGLDTSVLKDGTQFGAQVLHEEIASHGWILASEGNEPIFEADDEKEELHFTGYWALVKVEDIEKEEAEPVFYKSWRITHQFAGGEKE